MLYHHGRRWMTTSDLGERWRPWRVYMKNDGSKWEDRWNLQVLSIATDMHIWSRSASQRHTNSATTSLNGSRSVHLLSIGERWRTDTSTTHLYDSRSAYPVKWYDEDDGWERFSKYDLQVERDLIADRRSPKKWTREKESSCEKNQKMGWYLERWNSVPITASYGQIRDKKNVASNKPSWFRLGFE